MIQYEIILYYLTSSPTEARETICTVELDEKQDVLNGSLSPAVQAFGEQLSSGH